MKQFQPKRKAAKISNVKIFLFAHLVSWVQGITLSTFWKMASPTQNWCMTLQIENTKVFFMLLLSQDNKQDNPTAFELSFTVGLIWFTQPRSLKDYDNKQIYLSYLIPGAQCCQICEQLPLAITVQKTQQMSSKYYGIYFEEGYPLLTTLLTGGKL